MKSHSTWQTGPNGEKVETGTFVHQGQEFSAGGAVVTETHAIGYPKFDEIHYSRGIGPASTSIALEGTMRDWSGNIIGTCKIKAWWPIRSFIGDRMYQIEATIDGRTYTGRGLGSNMIWKGKLKRGSK